MTRSDDETVPTEHRGMQVVPNTFYARVSKGSLKPSDIMIGLETYWAFNMHGEVQDITIVRVITNLRLKVVHHILQMHCQ